MTQCSLCGGEAFEPVFIKEYQSNGLVWLLNAYICKDKCERNLNNRKW